MTRRIVLILCGLTMAIRTDTTGQTLDNPRAIGLSAYGAVITDLRAFGGSPAGLSGLKDWELLTSTYVSLGIEDAGFVFQGFSLGKRLADPLTAAMAYTPGTSLRFTMAPALYVGPGNLPGSRDLTLDYDQPLIAGLAYSIGERLSVGAGVRFLKEKISTTEYELVIRDTIAYAVVSQSSQNGSSWQVDASVLWRPIDPLVFSVQAKNLATMFRHSLPESYASLTLPRDILGEFHAAYSIVPQVTIAAGAATDGYGMAGYELRLPYGIDFRNGAYLKGGNGKLLQAFSLGLGWTFDFVSLDASYLRFVDDGMRNGEGSFAAFSADDITRVDLNPYTADRVSLSIRAMFGRVREGLARIESVEILGGIYPSAAQALAYRPLGRARVTNVASKPIQARVGFMLERYMDEPTETAPVYIRPGETLEIPFSAVFNDRLGGVTAMEVSDGQVFVTATPAEIYDDRTSARVLIHGRNAWNGDVNALRYFVTPDAPEVLRYGRDVLLQQRIALDTVPRELEGFARARLLIETFAGRILYVNDPKMSADYVQYPAETLERRGGDCDDMTVLLATLLGSIGISTAFVEVLPPEDAAKNHIYLLFDTGLAPRFGDHVSTNPKRYVVRRNRENTETVWIPFETTKISRGFEAGWSGGAQQYFDDVEVGLGLARGWVRIVDVN
jgi:hypothetical protein